MPCPSCGDERKVIRLGRNVVLMPLRKALDFYHRMREQARLGEIYWSIYCMNHAPTRFFFEKPDHARARQLILAGATVIPCPDCSAVSQPNAEI